MRTGNQQNSLFFKAFQPWLICTIGMLFYCYNYFLRVSPSVMQNELMQSLHITAYQFGNLAAFYYYIYTPMQIPAGMIYDRYGTRFVQFFACLIALSGVACFIWADNLQLACIGRFFIGLGTAFAYIGVLKIASSWLPPNRFATVAGLTTAFGMVSAIISDKYLTKFVHLLGYKHALHAALIIGVVLSFIILLFMRNKPKEPTVSGVNKPSMNGPKTFRELTKVLGIVMLKPQMWLIGIVGCLFYLPASVFLDLWGIPYLKTVYQLTPDQAATVVSMAFFGWIISGPSLGALSDKIKRRCSLLLISACMSAILLSIVFYVRGFSVTQLYALFFLIGIFCGAHPLCFALGKENNPVQFSGTAVAVTNFLIMIGGVVFQPIVGKLLDMHTGKVLLVNGIPVYSAADYNYALSVIPIGLIIAIFLTLFLKETYCQMEEDDEDTFLSSGKLATETRG